MQKNKTNISFFLKKEQKYQTDSPRPARPHVLFQNLFGYHQVCFSLNYGWTIYIDIPGTFQPNILFILIVWKCLIC